MTLSGLTIDEGLRQGFSIVDIHLGILVPTHDELGHAWFAGKVNVAQEHLSTQITLDQMNRLRFQISPRSKLGFQVAVTAVEGDSHSVGARMVADFFWQTVGTLTFLEHRLPYLTW